MTIGDRLQRLDQRVVAPVEQRLAGSRETGSWYGGRRMRLSVGILALLGATYDIVVVAVGAASIEVLTATPFMLLGRELRDFTVAARLLDRFAPQLARLLTHRLPLTRVDESLRALSGAYRLDDSDVVKIAIDPTQVS